MSKTTNDNKEKFYNFDNEDLRCPKCDGPMELCKQVTPYGTVLIKDKTTGGFIIATKTLVLSIVGDAFTAAQMDAALSKNHHLNSLLTTIATRGVTFKEEEDCVQHAINEFAEDLHWALLGSSNAFLDSNEELFDFIMEIAAVTYYHARELIAYYEKDDFDSSMKPEDGITQRRGLLAAHETILLSNCDVKPSVYYQAVNALETTISIVNYIEDTIYDVPVTYVDVINDKDDKEEDKHDAE